MQKRTRWKLLIIIKFSLFIIKKVHVAVKRLYIGSIFQKSVGIKV